ncbi:DUF4178 domain-containing protein [Pseudoponticoccus marisrubri]|uniref:DUF4178 domain-containing protein n=1 Tax=Pseudoponticoccus marisrubri TaxID=1685382 RepID=A0A0W7WPE2_9RHOB|nr:DUF4178 domain-containing protein [Pseudoponticoccus marisrubri]KUF12461.1 hypothetical protein AVJ23_01645 [Pseudoponticoccus marisrubri]
MPNCPNCGDAVPGRLDAALMAVCPSCDSTLYILDGRLNAAGTAGVMHDAPTLIGLGDRVQLDGRWLTVEGHARFSYGPGWWDEFWATAPKGDGVWISVDEGDVVAQSDLPDPPADLPARPRLGDTVQYRGETYAATEIDSGECTALRGVFPERLAVGDRFDYVNLSGPETTLLSAETHAGQTDWFLGAWLDPFELQVERA